MYHNTSSFENDEQELEQLNKDKMEVDEQQEQEDEEMILGSEFTKPLEAAPCHTPISRAIKNRNSLKSSLFRSKKQKTASNSQPNAGEWSCLPVEIRAHIISFFDAASLCRGAQVCQEFKFFCDDEKLWRQQCVSQLQLTAKPKSRSWKWLFRCRSVAFKKGANMTHGHFETEDPKGLYFGDWKNDNFDGFGYFEWTQHGLKYEGEYASGLRNGQGLLEWKTNGDKYEGEFADDMKHGKGLFKWHNGDVYDGEYSKDRKQGRGKITWGSHPGESYDGEWLADKKQGFGTYVWQNGGSYTGQWIDNKRHGFGVEKWPSGSIYKGNWAENEMHGWGFKICTRDGRPDGFYEGPFQDGRAHGRGFRQYEDGATYEGDYVADKRVGFGTYTWADGEKFSGSWAVGREKGFFVHSSGDVHYQEWFEDKLREERKTGTELYQVAWSRHQRRTD